jgi:putative CRISPR-associated protein (TIGR02619 family)
VNVKQLSKTAMPNLIVSTCGTSLLTNNASSDLRPLLIRHANLQNAADCPNAERLLIENHLRQRTQDVLRASETDLAKLSAEMNALLKFYDSNPTPQDMHILIHTDTWLGRATGNLLRQILEQRGFSVDTPTIQDLRTQDLDSFQLALSELVKWAAETLPAYQQGHYKIIFNLTGGFKSIQGFMQTLAMLYADETVYIFEGNKELLRLPRLPVRLDGEQIVHDHLAVLRPLALGLPVSRDAVDALPETLVLRLDDDRALSPWGELLWQQHKSAVYRESFHAAPSAKILLTDTFQRSIAGLSPDRYERLNQQIDKLAQYLHSQRATNLASLDVKALHVQRHGGCTHEFDAWHDQNAKRVFGWLKGDTFICEILENGVGH